ncbi:rod-binding protein [Sulfitobacter sp. JB4-11]|uniref:rod-binding protein n=1 Tax=Sulfitobacter rhodophyticola TaxID=3238304 RepID=UPI003518CB35
MDIPPVLPVPVDPAAKDAALRRAAQALEATFLAEMLNAAGLGAAREGLGGGGAGEDHFASFLSREHARIMVEGGGIGLSESIFNALKEQADDR